MAASIQKPSQNKFERSRAWDIPTLTYGFMIKLTKHQEAELRKFIEDAGNKYGVNTHPLQHSGCLSGFGIGNSPNHCDYIIFFDSSLSEKYYSLDLSSEIYYMALAELTTFDDFKSGIEQTIFELAAYDYLMDLLKKHKFQYEVNTDELGQIYNCQVDLPDDTMCEFSIWFSNSDSCRCDIVEDFNSIDYIIEAYDINATKKLIWTYIKELI